MVASQETARFMTRIKCIAHAVWLEILRKKDVYVLLILLGALLMVLVSLNVFGLGGLVIYVKDIGILMAWLFAWILSVNISSRLLPQEHDRGTIYPLLAKPITRMELLLGKWLGAWSIVSAATLVFYMLVCAVVLLKGGPGSLNIKALLQGYVLHVTALAIVCALTLLFSTRMNHDASSALAYVLTLAAFAILPRVPAFMVKAKGLSAAVFMVMYNVLPHFEVLDLRKRIVHDYGPAGTGTFLAVLLYGILYTIALLFASWLAYRKKRFSRGTLT